MALSLHAEYLLGYLAGAKNLAIMTEKVAVSSP